MGKSFNSQFTKEDVQITNKYMNKTPDHQSLGKCTLKSQWDTKSHQLEWIKFKILTVLSDGEDVEELDIIHD